ncbi:unnamed protein product [Urochloa decumbens]|uniref:F-box protein AT5G49610-like beta-propeller domain-containing protein n=1 Tax=Urochloa decumbens TaxID=240449 RepID=A0ABC9D9J6_9POAL
MAAPPSGAMSPPSLRASPRLPDEIVEDIFVRVPPSDPALLLRGALACKRFARLFAGTGFRRRYREHHRAAAAAPMLGFLANLTFTGGVARFIPTPGAGGFCPARDERHGYRAHDARHGRVLLTKLLPQGTTDLPHGHDQESVLAIWDPTTDDLRHLPLLHRRREVLTWNAAVLCGAAGDHIDCHSAPFRVVFLGIDAKNTTAHVFSSDSGEWSKVSRNNNLPGDDLDESQPGVVLAGNAAVHFILAKGNRILKLDVATGKMCLLHLPRLCSRVVLMAMDDGRKIGFAEMLLPLSALRIWSVELGPDGVEKRWVITRTIELDKHLPDDALVPRSMPCVAAYADGAGVIFLKMIDGLYALDLKTGQATRIPMTSGFYGIIPYVSFYTPVLRAALATSGEGFSAGASTSSSQTQGAHHLRGFLELAM